MKRTLIYLTLMLLSLQAIGQSQYDTILNTIEKNSLLLSSLKEQMVAQKLTNRSGIFLANPEVEFAYFWGRPSELGKRSEVSVKQSFDFPSVYAYKGQVANLENLNAELMYKSERINLLLMAKEICINLTYYNALAKDYELRLKNAEMIARPYENMSEVGSITLLEANKAQLNLTEVDNEIAQINAQQERLRSELKRLNGGIDVTYSATTFCLELIAPDFETWYAINEPKSPVLQYVRRQVEINEKQVRLNRAMSLPKFSAGYIGDLVVGEQFHGVSVGITIPLWENKNLIKQAKANVKASQTRAEDTRIQFYTNIQNTFLRASTLHKSVTKYRNSINNHNNAELLKTALDSGEISLLDYLLEMQLHFQTIENMLVLERDLELAIAQLSAFEL